MLSLSLSACYRVLNHAQSVDYRPLYSNPVPLAVCLSSHVLVLDQQSPCLFALTPFLQLSIQVKPMSTVIDAGAQVQQVLNVECKNVFVEAPLLEINFR